MKKFLSLLMMALLCVTTAWAETVEYSLGTSSPGTWTETTGGSNNVTKSRTVTTSDGFVLTHYNPVLTNNTAIGAMASGSLGLLGTDYFSVSHPSYTITELVLTLTTTGGPISNETGNGAYDNDTKTWTGSASEVILKGSGKQNKISRITIIYTTGGSTPTEPDPTAPTGDITFDPGAGEVTPGTTIAMSFSGTCSGIKYTLDGTSPSANNGTVYDASNPPAITAATTITAAAYNYSNSKYAFGTEATAEYTISAPPVIEPDGYATFDATKDMPSSDNPESITRAPVTFTCTNGTLDNGSEYRLFKNSETTFSVPNGYKIVKIEFTGDSRNPVNGFGTTQGLTFSGNDGVWIGEAQSVSFTASGSQVRCTLINVYFTEPETTGPKYYLVGDFNGWANAITSTSPSYKFHENNGTYTLTVQDLPACEFKIIRSDNGTSAAEWYGVINGQEANIHHNHHTGIGVTHDNGGNFRLQSAGTTSFSFEVNDGDPFNLTVTRDPILYIQGFDDWNNNVAMTQTSTGWTIPKTIAQGQEFRFIDEFGQWQGWNGGNYYINGINGSIDIKPGENVFVMNLSGDFVLNVDEGITKLNINEVDLNNVYTLVESGDDLVADGEYIIAGGPANEPYTVLMGAVSSSNNYGAKVDAGFTYDASAKTMTLTDDCQALVLTLGGSAGAWTFYTGTKYLSLTSSSNNLNTSDNANNDNAKWTIDVNKMPLSAQLIANKVFTTRYIEYNSGSPRFACYEGTQNKVALFKRVAPSNKSAMPTITPGSGDVYGLSQQVEITQANGGAIYYTLDGTTPTASSTPYNGAFPVTATQFGQVITVTAIAIEGDQEASHPVSATYKFIAPINRTLAQIEASGNPTGKTYTVTDDLQVVYVNSTKDFAIARDLTENTVNCPSEYVDFMSEVVTDVNDQQVGPWQDNNWVMLDFTDENADLTDVSINGIIQGGTLTGVYTDNNNYTIKVSGNVTCTEGSPYVPNVYSPANFYGDHTQTGPIVNEEPVTYWFKTPKVMEVCKFTYAMYYAGEYGGVTYAPGFYMQEGDEYALKGGVGLDMSYNSNPQLALTNGESYRFTGVIMKTGQTSGAKDAAENHHPQDGSTLNTNFKVAATDLTKAEGQVITAVNEVKTGSDVVSVTYCDLAGRMSQKPFAGVNIIVTRYSDGTVKTTKAIK